MRQPKQSHVCAQGQHNWSGRVTTQLQAATTQARLAIVPCMAPLHLELWLQVGQWSWNVLGEHGTLRALGRGERRGSQGPGPQCGGCWESLVFLFEILELCTRSQFP